ncbi:Thymus-specific serine protease [Coemansia erecta]|uniref:Thymus-specific serine protease n=1 Tax=Coemansia erecta TaxID=147472 RepID=A0A9W7XTK9_9FUNG|nr:Thymus-specific serine protease [Coemansia erecta]
MHPLVLLVLVLALWLAAAAAADGDDDGVAAHVTEHWISQPVDHLDAAAGRFAQRYLAQQQQQRRRAGAPIVIYIAGERGVVASDATSTFAAALARRLHGPLYVLEQRFYGASRPAATTSGINGTASGLMTSLRVEQMLHDIRRFAQSLVPEGSAAARVRWVLMGASFGGSLAAWTKFVWQDPRVFVVASGAPMRVPLAYWRFDLAASELLPGCAEGISRAVRLVDGALGRGGAEARALRGGFPESVARRGDALFAAALSLPVARAAQHGEGAALCARWAAAAGGGAEEDPVAGLAALVSAATAEASSECPQQPAWLWQQCGELGLWQTAPPPAHPFYAHRLRSRLLTLEHYTGLCRRCLPLGSLPPAAWRPAFERFAQAALQYLAGRGDVVFTVAGRDPWRYAGVPRGTGARVEVPGAAHGEDMWADGGVDEGPVALAREAVVARVERWMVAQGGRGGTGVPSAVVAIVCRQAYAAAVAAAGLAVYALCRAAAG